MNYVPIAISQIKKGDGITAPLRILLCKTEREYVTWYENMQAGGRYEGNYIKDPVKAIQDFRKRCKDLGVEAPEVELKPCEPDPKPLLMV